jgi:hypothetical protein
MKINYYSIIIPILLTIGYGCKTDESSEKIKLFIEKEISIYPELRLPDIYKDLFQDAYGPGHLIPDTTKAGQYLDWELNQTDWKDSIAYHELGIDHNFYRINLLLVKQGILPRDVLLNAMVESAKLSRNPGIEEWKKEWYSVFKVVKKIKPGLPDLEKDEKAISDNLNKGEYVMHHSEHYEQCYSPHYRIIHQTIFKNWLGNYIKNEKIK